ncbi:hypothetical protein V8E54_003852 [Elaphomyces granulatus]
MSPGPGPILHTTEEWDVRLVITQVPWLCIVLFMLQNKGLKVASNALSFLFAR